MGQKPLFAGHYWPANSSLRALYQIRGFNLGGKVMVGQTLPHLSEFISSHEMRLGDIFQIDDIQISYCENTHYRTEEQFSEEGPISLS